MKPGPLPDPGSIRSRVIMALRASDGSAAEIAKRAKVTAPQAKRALQSIEGQSRARCDRTVRPRQWSWIMDAGEELRVNEAYAAGRRDWVRSIGLPPHAGRRIAS
jgi:hypothetical protein